MPDLLKQLKQKKLICSYLETVDLCLNGKFYKPDIKWNTEKKKEYTRRIKTKLGIPKDQIKPLDFEHSSHKSKKVKYAFTCGSGEGESF